MWQEILQNSIVLIFGLLQTGVVVLIGGAFKMHTDVRDLKKDLNSAFCKLRDFEKRYELLRALVEASDRSDRESER